MHDHKIALFKTCQTCFGLGKVEHPKWGKFWREANWRDRSRATRYIAEEFFGTRSLPDREIECPICLGKRNIEFTHTSQNPCYRLEKV